MKNLMLFFFLVLCQGLTAQNETADPHHKVEVDSDLICFNYWRAIEKGAEPAKSEGWRGFDPKTCPVSFNPPQGRLMFEEIEYGCIIEHVVMDGKSSLTTYDCYTGTSVKYPMKFAAHLEIREDGGAYFLLLSPLGDKTEIVNQRFMEHYLVRTRQVPPIKKN